MPASGHQDHTTSPSALAPFVKGALRVHRVPPHVRDDRETPLGLGRDGRGYKSDLGKRRSGRFLREGLDRPATDLPAGPAKHLSAVARRAKAEACPHQGRGTGRRLTNSSVTHPEKI